MSQVVFTALGTVELLTAMAAFFSFTTLGSSHCVDRVSALKGRGREGKGQSHLCTEQAAIYHQSEQSHSRWSTKKYCVPSSLFRISHPSYTAFGKKK